MGLSLGYTSQGAIEYNVTFAQFTGEQIARTYQPVTGYSRSVTGAQVLTGPPTRAKYIWAVSASLDKASALVLDNLFRAWDLDRSSGIAAACSLLDSTFGPEISAEVVITTPPTFSYVSEHFVVIDMGLTEV